MHQRYCPCRRVRHEVSSLLCYQCGQAACQGLPSDEFCPFLCAYCIDNYQLGRASHRLLSQTEAMFRCTADTRPVVHWHIAPYMHSLDKDDCGTNEQRRSELLPAVSAAA